MGKTRTGKAAVICTAVAFVLVVIAFTTPNWLETDGKLDNPQFVKIGKTIQNSMLKICVYIVYIKKKIKC